jgi:hypothetical protein
MMESTKDCETSEKWRKARVSYGGYQEQRRRTIPSPTDVLGTLYAKILSVFDSFRRVADVIVVVSPIRAAGQNFGSAVCEVLSVSLADEALRTAWSEQSMGTTAGTTRVHQVKQEGGEG